MKEEKDPDEIPTKFHAIFRHWEEERLKANDEWDVAENWTVAVQELISELMGKIEQRNSVLEGKVSKLESELMGYRLRDMDALREELKRREVGPDLKYTKDPPRKSGDGLWYWHRTVWENWDEDGDRALHDIRFVVAGFDEDTKEFTQWFWQDIYGELVSLDIEDGHWAGPIIPPEEPNDEQV